MDRAKLSFRFILVSESFVLSIRITYFTRKSGISFVTRDTQGRGVI